MGEGELKLFLPKYNGSLSSTERIEYATGLSEEISKGLLFERTDQVAALAELLKLGSLLDFDVPAVQHLLKLKNLRLLEDDELFVSYSSVSRCQIM